MGRVPFEIIEKFLVLADFEIPESLRRSLFGKPSTGVRGMIARVALSQVEGNVFKDRWKFTPARYS
jgi:hypothetical protein